MDRKYTIENLEYILDKLSSLIWLKDNEGKYIYINKSGVEQSGLPKDQIIGKTDYEVLNYEIAKQCVETDRVLIDKNYHAYYNEEHSKINGQDMWYRVNKFKIKENSDEKYILGGIAEEISLNRNIQMELENNLMKYFDGNKTDRMVFLESVASKIKKTLKCKDIEAFKYNEDEKKFSLYFSLNKESMRFAENSEINIDEQIENKLCSNGFCRDRYTEINDYIMKIQNNYTGDKVKIKHIKLANKLLGLVCIFYDNDQDMISLDEAFLDEILTKISIILKQIENKAEVLSIKEKKDELENIIKLGCIKTDFFANISHEFRTPINVILSIIQLINSDDEKNINEKYKKYLSVLQQNSYRLLRLVDNVLDTSKINNGFSELKLENYNIISIVEDITMFSAKYMDEKKRNIIFDTNEEEIILACDAEKIEKIVLNLISNAVKFSEPNTDIEVTINADLKEERVFVSVKNKGKSIEEQDKENIFGKCIQGDKLLIRRSEGSGMGLFLARKFLEMHGGDIYLDDLEEDTQFTFFLPIKTVEGEYRYNRDLDKNYVINKCNIEFSDIYW